jgi:hypothetical protein
MPDPIADYHALESDYRRRFDETLPATKATILDALAAVGIRRVVVAFDGSGDSGQVESITAFDSQGTERELPTIDIEVSVLDFWGTTPPSSQHTLAEAIDGLVWSLLERTHGGWENDDGGYGEISFDTAERTIKLELNTRYTETTYHEHEF